MHGFARSSLAVTVVTVMFVGFALHAANIAGEAQFEAETGDWYSLEMTLVGESLRRHLPPDARIALNPAGAVPYFSRLYAYDMLGLNNEHIAHVPVALGLGLVGHEKGDGAYVLDQAPDVILFGNVRIVPAGPVDLRGLQWRPVLRSEKEIADDPRFAVEYVADQLPLADGRYVVFFRRRGFEIGQVRGGASLPSTWPGLRSAAHVFFAARGRH